MALTPLSNPQAEAQANANGQQIYWIPPGSSTPEAVPYGFNTAQYGGDATLFVEDNSPSTGGAQQVQTAQSAPASNNGYASGVNFSNFPTNNVNPNESASSLAAYNQGIASANGVPSGSYQWFIDLGYSPSVASRLAAPVSFFLQEGMTQSQASSAAGPDPSQTVAQYQQKQAQGQSSSSQTPQTSNSSSTPNYTPMSNPAAAKAAVAAGQQLYWKPPGSNNYQAVPPYFDTSNYPGDNTLYAGPPTSSSTDPSATNPNQFNPSASGGGTTTGSTNGTPTSSSGGVTTSAPTYVGLANPAAEQAALAAGQQLYWQAPGSSTYQAVPSNFNTAAYPGDNTLYTLSAQASPNSGVTSAQQSAQSIVDSVLQEYGLSSLSNWAWGEITNGASADQVQLDLYNQQAFKNRFPAIFQRQAAGLAPITPAQYISYEKTAQDLGQAAGLPSGFIQGYTDKLLANGVSTTELNDRLQKGLLAVTQAAPDVLSEFQNYYGVDQGHLAAYFLDPTNALPYLEKQAAAATMGAQANEAGWGNLNQTDAMNLANEGVTPSTAKTGFGKLASLSQLMTALPGTQEQNISPETQIQAEFMGNATDQNIIAQRQRNRVAAMHSGGTFGESTHGVTGLGTVGQAI